MQKGEVEEARFSLWVYFQRNISILFNIIFIVYFLFLENRLFLRIDRLFNEETPDILLGSLVLLTLILDTVGTVLKAPIMRNRLRKIKGGGKFSNFLLVCWVFHFVLSFFLLILLSPSFGIPYEGWLFIILSIINMFKELFLLFLLAVPQKFSSLEGVAFWEVLGDLSLFLSGTMAISFSWNYIASKIVLDKEVVAVFVLEILLLILAFLFFFLGARLVYLWEEKERARTLKERALFLFTLLGAALTAIWGIL
ncbi:MAG: hypothetical protein ACPLPW_04555 [bacterium]